jgi:hypothetical protein
LQVVGGVIKLVSGLLTGDWRRAWNGAKQIVAGAIRAVIGVLRVTTAPIRQLLSAPVRAGVGLVKTLFNGLVGFIKGIPGRMASAGRGAFNWIKTAISSAIEGAKTLLRNFKITVNVPGGKLGKAVAGALGVDGGISIQPFGFLAGGGTLSRGRAIVGEQGPELAEITPGGTKITPLTGGLGAGIASYMSGEGERVTEIPLVIDGEVVTRVVYRHASKKAAFR